MSTKPLLLDGVVEQENELSSLRDRVCSLEAEITSLRDSIAMQGKENYRTIARLLSPLYKALLPVFGEICEVSDARTNPSSSSSDAWQQIKARLAPRLREAVEILLLQKTMRRTQLASALKMDYSNCNKNVIAILLRQGWIVDNGGDLSLKQL